MRLSHSGSTRFQNTRDSTSLFRSNTHLAPISVQGSPWCSGSYFLLLPRSLCKSATTMISGVVWSDCGRERERERERKGLSFLSAFGESSPFSLSLSLSLIFSTTLPLLAKQSSSAEAKIRVIACCNSSNVFGHRQTCLRSLISSLILASFFFFSKLPAVTWLLLPSLTSFLLLLLLFLQLQKKLLSLHVCLIQRKESTMQWLKKKSNKLLVLSWQVNISLELRRLLLIPITTFALQFESWEYVSILFFFDAFVCRFPHPHNGIRLSGGPGMLQVRNAEVSFKQICENKHLKVGTQPTTLTLSKLPAEILLLITNQACKSAPNVPKRVCNVYVFQQSFHFAYHHWWLGKVPNLDKRILPTNLALTPGPLSSFLPHKEGWHPAEGGPESRGLVRPSVALPEEVRLRTRTVEEGIPPAQGGTAGPHNLPQRDKGPPWQNYHHHHHLLLLLLPDSLVTFRSCQKLHPSVRPSRSWRAAWRPRCWTRACPAARRTFPPGTRRTRAAPASGPPATRPRPARGCTAGAARGSTAPTWPTTSGRQGHVHGILLI